MCDISVNSSSTEGAISGFISRVQTYIIEASRKSGDTIINAIDNSGGSFIDSLKAEVEQEVMLMDSVGELLIAMADHIRSTASALADVDAAYNNVKI